MAPYASNSARKAIIGPIHFLHCIWYYLQIAVLTPVAAIANTYYLVNHPRRAYPTLVASRNDTIIYSTTPSGIVHSDEGAYIEPARTNRRWVKPREYYRRLCGIKADCPPEVLSGSLEGPLLQQGSVLLYQGNPVYIGEEIGRQPFQREHIATHSIHLDTGNSFVLFIPSVFLDKTNLIDENPSAYHHTQVGQIYNNLPFLLIPSPAVTIPSPRR